MSDSSDSRIDARLRSVSYLVPVVVGFGFLAMTASVAMASSVNISNAAGRNDACSANSVTHAFVTISDIQGHTSGHGAGWHDLTPTLTNGPVQFDLLESGTESTEAPSSDDCLISTVDDGSSGLPAGKYEQLRLQLVANGGQTGPSKNACSSLGAGIFNCVELSDGTFHTLTVPSGTIKIPSSQISQGGLTVATGQGDDLDIDIDVCHDIVATGSAKGAKSNDKGGKKGKGGGPGGGYVFKPVLHAGQITLNPLIAGNVVEGTASGNKVTSGTSGVAGASVWLEEAPSSPNFTQAAPAPGTTAENVDNVLVRTTTDSNGHFVMCPIPAGKYSIVSSAPAPSGAGAASAASNPSDVTITTAVNVTSNGGPNNLIIPLLSASAGASTLSAQFTSQQGTPVPSATPTPIAATVNFAVAQGESSGNQDPIPSLAGTTTSPVTTTSDGTGTGGPNCVSKCPSGTDCACVSVVVPPDNPVIGTAGGPYSITGGNPTYSVFGTASTCAPANLITPATTPPLPEPTLSFLQCH